MPTTEPLSSIDDNGDRSSNQASTDISNSLWQCNDAALAVELLQTFRTALTHSNISDNEHHQQQHHRDASPLFVAISGAAVRFPELEIVCLEAAADLAEIIVGPAFWKQRHVQELWMRPDADVQPWPAGQGSTTHDHAEQRPSSAECSNHRGSYLESCDISTVSGPRERKNPERRKNNSEISGLTSVTTHGITDATPFNSSSADHRHCHIPEVLPAAMIRFASRYTVNKHNNTDEGEDVLEHAYTKSPENARIVQAQHRLVMALCLPPSQPQSAICQHPASIKEQPHNWTIPTIQREVLDMLSGYIAGRDFLHLEPLRDGESTELLKCSHVLVTSCHNLFLGGLLSHRGSPPPIVVLEFLFGSVEVACKKLRQTERIRSSGKVDHNVRDISVEIATTALSSLALIPRIQATTFVERLVPITCQLHTAVKGEIARFRLGLEKDGSSASSISRLDSLDRCVKSCRHLLRSLINEPVTAKNVMEFLLKLSTLPSDDHEAGHFRESPSELSSTLHGLALRHASYAMDVLDSSIWKKETISSSPGHAAPPALLRVFWRPMIRNCGRTLTIAQKSILKQLDHETEEIQTSHTAHGDELLQCACVAVSCLVSFLEKENGCKHGVLSPLEWDSLLESLVKGVLPLLSLLQAFTGTQSGKGTTVNTLRSRLRDLLVVLLQRLQRKTMARVCQYLKSFDPYLLSMQLLKDAVPFLNMNESRALGCFAVKCAYMSSFEIPGNQCAWQERLSSLFKLIFQRNNKEGSFPLKTVFQLELLRTMSGSSYDWVRALEDDSATIMFERKIMWSSLLYTYRPVETSQLEQFLHRTIIPSLHTLLRNISTEDSFKEEFQSSCESRVSLTLSSGRDVLSLQEIKQVLYKTVALSKPTVSVQVQLCGISLLGDIYRGTATKTEQKSSVAKLLRTIAVQDFLSASDEGTTQPDPFQWFKCSYYVTIRAAAVLEISRCLKYIYRRNAPDLFTEDLESFLGSLCKVLNEYATKLNSQSFELFSLLAAYALDGLTILDGTLNEAQCTPSLNCRAIASLKHSNQCCGQITDTLVRFLSLSNRALVLPDSKDTALLLRSFRIYHYRMLGDFCACCIPIQGLSSRGIKLLSCFDRDGFNDHEADAKNCCLWLFLQNSLLTFQKDMKRQNLKCSPLLLEEALCDTRLILSIFLRTITSTAEEEWIQALARLPALLPGLLALQDMNGGHDMLESLFSVLAGRIEATTVNLRTDSSTVNRAGLLAILHVIHDVLLHASTIDMPASLQIKMSTMCYECISGYLRTDIYVSFIRHLSFCCLTVLLKLISDDVADKLKKIMSSRHPSENSNAMTKTASRLLFLRVEGETTEKHRASAIPPEALETEAEQIQYFEAAQGSTPASAWLYQDDTLLTLRFGLEGSRFAGWIEMIVRTVASRVRFMFRVDSACWIDSPELISMSRHSVPSPEGEGVDSDSCLNTGRSRDSVASAVTARLDALSTRFEDAMKYESIHDPHTELHKSDLSDEGSPLLPRCTCFDDLKYLTSDASARINSIYARSKSLTSDEGHALLSNELVLQSCDPVDYGHENTQSETQDISVADWVAAAVRDKTTYQSAMNQIDVLMKSARCESLGCVKLTGRGLWRAISMLDHAVEMGTHKIALLSASAGEARSNSPSEHKETSLLNSLNFSPAFRKLAESLGNVKQTQQLNFFSAGLDTQCSEDDLTIVWTDEKNYDRPTRSACMVVFHVVNLMPVGQVIRKLHVGNDNVIILFLEESTELSYAQDPVMTKPILSGDFGFVVIFVRYLQRDNATKVSLRVREAIPQALKDVLNHMICDHQMSLHQTAHFIRSLAIRADLACRTTLDTLTPPSGCLARYQRFKGLQRFT